MLTKSLPLQSILRSVQTGALLLAAVAGVATAQAGEEYSRASNKDKNVIQQAPPAEPKFYLTLMGGAEFDYHATAFISDGRPVFLGTPYVPALAGTIYTAKIQTRDFTSTHDPVVNAKAEAGYQVLPYLSVFAGFTYSHANGHERRVGYVNDNNGQAFGFSQKYDLYASVGDYQAYTGRAGIKLNTPRTLLDLLHLPRAISPYAMLSAGGKYVESQEISFYSGTQPRFVDTGYSTLYGNSWVLNVEGALGYELKLTRNASIILESGYGYDTKPDRGGLKPGISGTNSGGDRFYSNVSLGGKIRF